LTNHATTPTETTAGTPGRRGRTVNIVLWVLQVLLAALFVFAAIPKLLGNPAAVDGFARLGLGQWFRYFTGAVELAGAIGLLIPRLSALAALGLVGVMVGAVITHILVLGPATLAFIPAAVGVILASIAWVRWTGRAGVAARAGSGERAI
jgi:uncharacterized membrane protein YphA (DoxX/SURF4 family)